MANFNDQELFTKGVAYAEFFDVGSDELLAYSRYVTDFGMNGTMNDGDIEGGIGNQLIMSIPDTTRLEITATTANSDLGMLALPIGGLLQYDGIVETSTIITANGTTLAAPQNAVAPYGAENGPVCYVIAAMKDGVAANVPNNGTPYYINQGGNLEGFEAEAGTSYCVKYWTRVSSAEELQIPANYQPSIARAHFAVNVYARSGDGSAMSGSLAKIRHYYIPRYQFNQPLQITENQTTPGTTNLGGRALSYADALSGGFCAAAGNEGYGYIVDEIVGGGATDTVQGIYFIGAGGGVEVATGFSEEVALKYDINGRLTQISDMSANVELSSSAEGVATVSAGNNGYVTIRGVASGTATITASVENSKTGVTYTDSITVTVT